jgi:hypothetical protein
MFEAELARFNSIIEERTAARIELDRILIRGHVPERYDAVNAYVEALDQCIAELEVWNERLLVKLEHAYGKQVSIPPDDDPVWALIRKSHAMSWITSMRGERYELARQLHIIDELNESTADSSDSDNGV